MPFEPEQVLAFDSFGSRCSVRVTGDSPDRPAAAAALSAQQILYAWHERFSRFIPSSELCRLNDDARITVPVSQTMATFVSAAVAAARLTGGLVDPTLISEIQRAGYAQHLEPGPRDVREVLSTAPPRRPARPHPAARWRAIRVDRAASTVTRPVGVALDSGGVGKGLFADLLAERLQAHDAFVVDCGGDLRIGGAGRLARAVQVTSPFDGSILREIPVSEGGVATSGIGRRSWTGRDGRPAHHLLDPESGEPAFTGIVQATALAPTAAEAEARAKAALLAGPAVADRWLAHGGVLVLDDGDVRVVPGRMVRVDPARSMRLPDGRRLRVQPRLAA